MRDLRERDKIGRQTREECPSVNHNILYSDIGEEYERNIRYPRKVDIVLGARDLGELDPKQQQNPKPDLEWLYSEYVYRYTG